MSVEIKQNVTQQQTSSEDPSSWPTFVPRSNFKARYFADSATVNGVNVQPNSFVLLFGEQVAEIPAAIFNVFFTEP